MQIYIHPFQTSQCKKTKQTIKQKNIPRLVKIFEIYLQKKLKTDKRESSIKKVKEKADSEGSFAKVDVKRMGSPEFGDRGEKEAQ